METVRSYGAEGGEFEGPEWRRDLNRGATRTKCRDATERYCGDAKSERE